MTKENTVVSENIDALKRAMTAAVSGKLMKTFLGDHYSVPSAVMLAASSTTIAANSDPDTLYGSFLRLVSRALCTSAADSMIDAAYSVITPAGDIQDKQTLEQAQKELSSAFALLQEEIKDVTQDVSRFSTQSESIILGSVSDKDNTDNAVILKKGEGSTNHINIPAGHIICDRCHNPGKKSKSKVLKVAHLELMPQEIKDLNGKTLCPKCAKEVDEIMANIIADEKARIEQEKLLAAAEEAKKQNAQKIAELEAEEARLKKELEELEAALAVVPEVLKDVTAHKVEECRFSIQNVHVQLEKLTGTSSTAIPMGPAKPTTPSVVRALTKKERKAQRRALLGK